MEREKIALGKQRVNPVIISIFVISRYQEGEFAGQRNEEISTIKTTLCKSSYLINCAKFAFRFQKFNFFPQTRLGTVELF